MSSVAEKTYLTPQQYLEIEERSEVRHEFHRGEMFAMAGATEGHNLAAGNIVFVLGNQLEGRPCRVYHSQMRIFVDAAGLYTYPDVTVVCGPPRFADPKKTTLLNPTVLFEVLSESTEAYDRGTKFQHYQRIESLREYVLVATDAPRVEVFRRGEDGWMYSKLERLEDELRLDSIDGRILLAKVYAQLDLPAPPSLRGPIVEP